MLMSVRVLLSNHTPATDGLQWTHRPGLVILLQEPLRDADGVDSQHLHLFFFSQAVADILSPSLC